MRRTILWSTLAVLLAALLAIAPNALWLSRSNAIIHNAGAEAITLRLVYMGQPDRVIATGEFAPGASRFLWLDPLGEATLVVDVEDGDGWRRHCANYIEQGMYRVEIVARGPDEVLCRTELPLLKRLLVLDFLS
jgi:hypothetical protein